MLNYMRADLYRIFSRPLPWLWFLIAVGLPALAVLGMGEQYELAQVLLGAQVGIYIIFIFLSLILNEYTFREDMQLGMLKNDTTSGVSRGQLFMAKYLVLGLSNKDDYGAKFGTLLCGLNAIFVVVRLGMEYLM